MWIIYHKTKKKIKSSDILFNNNDIQNKITEKEVSQALEKFRKYTKENGFDDKAKELQREYSKLESKYKKQENIKPHQKDISTSKTLSEVNKIIELVNNKEQGYISEDVDFETIDEIIYEGKHYNELLNKKIRNYNDINIDTLDGETLIITKDTAHKIATRDKIKNKNGEYELLNDELYLVKLKAGLYIDELAKTSIGNNKIIPDTKNHKFVKDSFNYRTAYFEDIDGKYYKITMSVGINEAINTIYNVGKMEDFAKKRETSKVSGSKAKLVSSKNNISQNQEKIKLDQRVSGDKLLDIKDLINEIKSVGADVDEYGYVTYIIKQQKKMLII